MKSPRNSPPPKPVLNSYWLPLSRGLFALIDADDVEKVSKWLWSALVRKGPYSPYAFRREMERTIYLHRFIVNAPEGMDVDHIDGNGLNCKKINLRICTHADNQKNYRKTMSKTSSRFKGVSFSKGHRKWVAKIKMNHKTVNLGYFSDEMKAAEAYNAAARIYFGQFANLNVIA